MNIKWLLLCVLFITTACQSFQNTNVENTRVILFLTKGVNPSQVETTLQYINNQVDVVQLSLIRQSNKKQLIVNVKSNQPESDWLDKLIALKLIEYAEIDAKKMAK